MGCLINLQFCIKATILKTDKPVLSENFPSGDMVHDYKRLTNII